MNVYMDTLTAEQPHSYTYYNMILLIKLRDAMTCSMCNMHTGQYASNMMSDSATGQYLVLSLSVEHSINQYQRSEESR